MITKRYRGLLFFPMLFACSDSSSSPIKDIGAIDEGAGDGRSAEAGPDRGSDASATSLVLEVFPATMKTAVGATALLLAEMQVEPQSAPASLGVTASPVLPLEMMPAEKTGGGVYEILLKPGAGHADKTITVEVKAASGGLVHKKSMQVKVVSWPNNEETAEGKLLREKFIDYLADKKLALGISRSTAWQDLGTFAEVVIVDHRLFLSDEWEMVLSQHVTIAPHDWAEIYLRRRSELSPSFAAKMQSVSTDQTITEISPPESVFRGF